MTFFGAEPPPLADSAIPPSFFFPSKHHAAPPTTAFPPELFLERRKCFFFFPPFPPEGLKLTISFLPPPRRARRSFIPTTAASFLLGQCDKVVFSDRIKRTLPYKALGPFSFLPPPCGMVSPFFFKGVSFTPMKV